MNISAESTFNVVISVFNRCEWMCETNHAAYERTQWISVSAQIHYVMCCVVLCTMYVHVDRRVSTPYWPRLVNSSKYVILNANHCLFSLPLSLSLSLTISAIVCVWLLMYWFFFCCSYSKPKKEAFCQVQFNILANKICCHIWNIGWLNALPQTIFYAIAIAVVFSVRAENIWLFEIPSKSQLNIKKSLLLLGFFLFLLFETD